MWLGCCLPADIELVRYDRDGIRDKIKIFCCFAFLSAFPGDVLGVCARGLITAVSEHLQLLPETVVWMHLWPSCTATT